MYNDMERNIVCYDVETTGLSTQNDYVIQLSAVKFDRNFNILGKFDEYIRPIGNWYMSDGAEEIHGISTRFLMENGRPMKEVGKEFLEFTKDCDILSYNGNKFDIKILTKDLRLEGYTFELDSRAFFDAYILESRLHPRTLSNVYFNYTGKQLDGAHNALNDVVATVEVFKHQTEMFKKDNITIDDISNFDESRLICVDGFIKRYNNIGEQEQLFFAKGKYKDKDIIDVARLDPSYIKWVMEVADVDVHTKNVIRNYYAKNRERLK
jgi:DNA polymerase-3 subunit epsilon